MIIGYARTSTVEQIAGLEAQLKNSKQLIAKNLSGAGVIRCRPYSTWSGDGICKEGDVLVVTN